MKMRWWLAAVSAGAAALGLAAAPGFVPDSAKVAHPAALALHSDRRLQMDGKTIEGLARDVMAMSEERTLALIRDEHGIDPRMLCPGCGSPKLEFSLREPDAVRCPECQVPVTEASYPPTGAVNGPNTLGETVTYRFYRKGPTDYFITANAGLRRHRALAEACRALAWKYHATRDETYARRAAAMLDRFATAYRHWPIVRTDRPTSYTTNYVIGPARPYDAWWIGRWHGLLFEEIPQDLVFAYDLVYTSPEWEKLSKERGYDARGHVEKDFFRESAALALLAYEDQSGDIGNLSASLYQSLIHLGRVLNDPDMVHRAVHEMGEMIRLFYHFDGMEYEGAMTYHGIVTGRMGIADRALRSYTDPPGYRDTRFGLRLENAEFSKQFPIHGKAWRVWSQMRFPNGNAVCVHDTNWPEGRAPTPPDAEAANVELNAYGHYAIGRGKGPDAMQAHLHFCPRISGGHFHQDRLNLILWGAGEELLSDIGYVNVGKKHRYFVNRSLAHNTVDVLFDREPEPPKEEEPGDLPHDPIARFRAKAMAERPGVYANSRLLAYDPGTVSGKQVQLIEAESPGPAWMRVSQRRRALLMVAVDENRGYVVDLFRVAGGNRHRFTLRPSADEDVATECALPLASRPGTLAGAGVPYGAASKTAESYAWLVHDLKAAETAAPWSLTWRGAESGASLRAFFRGQPGSAVTLGQSPTLRRGRQDSRRADDFQGPHLLVERKGETGFGSAFAAVYDAWRQEKAPLVTSVEWLDLGAGASAAGAIAAVVRLGDREDLVYASTDDQTREVRGCRLSGRFAVVSFQAGRPAWAWCREGSVEAPGVRVACLPAARLPITRVLRKAAGDPVDGFEVAGSIADAEALKGQWARAILGDGTAYGYRVEGVTPQGAGCRVAVHDEPGWQRTETGAELLFNPFYAIEGPCALEVARSAFGRREETTAPRAK